MAHSKKSNIYADEIVRKDKAQLGTERSPQPKGDLYFKTGHKFYKPSSQDRKSSRTNREVKTRNRARAGSGSLKKHNTMPKKNLEIKTNAEEP